MIWKGQVIQNFSHTVEGCERVCRYPIPQLKMYLKCVVNKRPQGQEKNLELKERRQNKRLLKAIKNPCLPKSSTDIWALELRVQWSTVQ